MDRMEAAVTISEITSFPEIGYCAQCHLVQYETPDGPCCEAGHGGADTLIAAEHEAALHRPQGRPAGQYVPVVDFHVAQGLKGSMTVDFAKTYMAPHALVIDFEVHRAAMKSVELRYNARIKDLELRQQHVIDIATGRGGLGVT